MPTSVQSNRSRSARLEMRVTQAQKALIETAAALEGRSVSDFAIASLQEAARRALETHDKISLSLIDSKLFVDALIKPRAKLDRLSETIGKYRDNTGV